MINYIDGLTFDDLMLIPKYSTISSRSEVDLSVSLSKDFKFFLPYTPSNMATITEIPMARLMYENKALAIFHRFSSFEQQLEWLEEIKSWHNGTRYVGFSIGVRETDYSKVDILVSQGAEVILIDVAHGWSDHCLKMTSYIAEKYPNVLLISGNSAEGEGARAIWKAGADVCKNGVGQGSICLTRINVGNGAMSASSLDDCHNARLKLEKELGRKLFLINDGGCNVPGDVAKALCWADIVMTGNIFSASSKTPGKIIEIEKDGKVRQYKKYVGSSTHKNGSYNEGVQALNEYKGETSEIIRRLNEGIRSCCSYQGVFNLVDLKKDPRFVRMTNAGVRESGAHNLDIIFQDK